MEWYLKSQQQLPYLKKGFFFLPSTETHFLHYAVSFERDPESANEH